jgi:hypothetical protein
MLNTPDVRTVTAHRTLQNETDEPPTGVVQFSVINLLNPACSL